MSPAAAPARAFRAWTYETSLLVDQSVDEELPPTQFHEYFAPDYCISVVPSKEIERDNQNKKEVRHIFQCRVYAMADKRNVLSCSCPLPPLPFPWPKVMRTIPQRSSRRPE